MRLQEWEAADGGMVVRDGKAWISRGELKPLERWRSALGCWRGVGVEDFAEFDGEGGQDEGVGFRGFEVLLEFSGEARALFEAEHA